MVLVIMTIQTVYCPKVANVVDMFAKISEIS